MKEIKDYLHLYLGCEAMAKMKSVNYEQKIQMTGYNLFANEHEIEYIKPILRPLSDMTEEEFNKYNDFLFTTEFAIGDYTRTEHYAEMTRYLLSKHFDLFQLIESGLAIDKTKT